MFYRKGHIMLTLKNLNEAERFVTRQQRLGNNVRWEGWDIVFFRESDKGRTAKHGVWSRTAEAYGFDNRSPVTDAGTWEVDYRNVRRAKRTRN